MLHVTRVRLAFLLVPFALACAADDRDFSGKWQLNPDRSDLHALPTDVYPTLVVEQRGDTLRCTATPAAGAPIQWMYHLNGDDYKYQIGADSWNSAVKWEGAALLINTLVSGSADYTVMDRWTLSRDRNQLNIQRQIERSGNLVEGFLVYRREGAIGAPPSSTGTAVAEHLSATPPVALVRRPDPPPPAPPLPSQFVIPKGTHVLLSLNNPVSTKDSKAGDRLYLQTAFPVSEGDRVVIPKGSYVQASVASSKPAGRGPHKGDIYIVFDSLTLPNGVTRDFHARLTSADTVNGKVDPDEGKIGGTGKKDSPSEVVRDVGIGTGGGVLLGGIAGHPIAGAAVGAAAGAAAVLLSKNKDVILPRGTSVEMVLDRDLTYTPDELRK